MKYDVCTSEVVMGEVPVWRNGLVDGVKCIGIGDVVQEGCDTVGVVSFVLSL